MLDSPVENKSTLNISGSGILSSQTDVLRANGIAVFHRSVTEPLLRDECAFRCAPQARDRHRFHLLLSWSRLWACRYGLTKKRPISRPKPRKALLSFTNGLAMVGQSCSPTRRTLHPYARPSSATWPAFNP